ncbi:MAG: M23 family metallopeptidase, partial [Candidatus Hydrogenedentes bacterium]|nr:M23 family metallopeptidase [Candidatus Hydrogenedentota bacterium]
SEPSADLIIQEIRLRKVSLLDLTGDLVAIQDRVAHTPSIWPTANQRRRITSGFGYRRDPLGRSVRHHDGTDISAPYGASIVATADGKVLESAWDGDLGNVVRIDHGYGIVTTYGHMSKRSVEAGKTIMRGDEIGKVGSTGRSTGPHIHYEIHVNGKLVDPQQYFGK